MSRRTPATGRGDTRDRRRLDHDAGRPAPADFTLNAGQTVVDVLTGSSVDVPVDLNRLNGSNGNVSFAASGLPTGMSASFSRNPLAGTGTRTILTLSAAEGAAHSDQYTPIAVTATPGSGPATGRA